MANQQKQQATPLEKALPPRIVAKVWLICAATGDAFDDVVADAIDLHHDEIVSETGEPGAVQA